MSKKLVARTIKWDDELPVDHEYEDRMAEIHDSIVCNQVIVEDDDTATQGPVIIPRIPSPAEWDACLQ